MLDRELSMLRLSENEPVQPVLDKMRELYAKLAIAASRTQSRQVSQDAQPAAGVLAAIYKRTQLATKPKSMDIGVDSHQDSGRRFSSLYTARR
ncbi:hypothetical protein CLOP_g2836 [Closterium sp. NIES-67]|nr:hypothetical protein CLOP_g2836 [Closterium sp. NIES-67]